MNQATELPPSSVGLTITTELLVMFRDLHGARWCSDDLIGSLRRKLGHTCANSGDPDAATRALEQSRVLLKKMCDDCPYSCKMKAW